MVKKEKAMKGCVFLMMNVYLVGNSA